MNPALADMKDKWATLPREDRLAATRAYCDSDGVYRLTVLHVADLEEWVRGEWDRFMPAMVDW